MANININLGLTTLTAYNTRALDVGSASMAERVNLFFQASYNFGTTHPYYNSSTLNGSTLRLNFSDGAYSLYSGIVLADPNAATGEATVTNLESTLPSYFRLTVGGQLNYHYESTGSGGSLVPAGGTINDVAIQTLLPTYSSSYDSTFGNVVAGLHGADALAIGRYRRQHHIADWSRRQAARIEHLERQLQHQRQPDRHRPKPQQRRRVRHRRLLH
jgi:hypothetical protein